MVYTLDSKTLLGFSDFIPANSAADWTIQEDWGGGAGGAGVFGILPLVAVKHIFYESLIIIQLSNM